MISRFNIENKGELNDMSFLKQLKEQVQADIEHVLDRNDKPFQTDDGKYEAESKNSTSS